VAPGAPGAVGAPGHGADVTGGRTHPAGIGSRESGSGLAAALVGAAVAMVTLSLLLAAFVAGRRAFDGTESTLQAQQRARSALHFVVDDLRRAGISPDNAAADPDAGPEPIEGAFGTALALRLARVTPDEPPVPGESPELPECEIVAYALGDGAGPSSGTLEFDTLLGGAPSQVRISSLALVQDSPPYTLYRVLVDPATGSSTRLPVVDGVEALRFTYHAGGGNGAIPAPGGADTPTGRAARQAIRWACVEIVTAAGGRAWIACAAPRNAGLRALALGEHP
jgi:hypothetical protein